jgi:hypothetical protein
MAKLPPKPLNPVHEFFPVGADGQSPMNYGPKQVKESDKPEEIANKYSLGGESLLNKNGDPDDPTDYYSENPIVDDPDRPGEKIRKKDLEARQKSQSVEIGKEASNELNEVVLTPNNKIETPALSMQAGKSKKKGRTILGKNIDDYKRRWANSPRSS